MIPFKPELIVFDLDGTLVDSSPDIVVAINKMLVAMKLPVYPEQQVKQWMGNGAEMLVRRALTGELEPKREQKNLLQAMALLSEFYSTHICVHSQLYPGVIAGLEKLKGANIHLACITNKPSQFTLPLLADIGLKGYFQFVASGDTFSTMKPDPQPLLEATKEFSVKAEHALMVGDSVNDIQAGKSAGFKTALVPYGYLGQYTVNELNADYNVESIEHLATLFMGSQGLKSLL